MLDLRSEAGLTGGTGWNCRRQAGPSTSLGMTGEKAAMPMGERSVRRRPAPSHSLAVSAILLAIPCTVFSQQPTGGTAGATAKVEEVYKPIPGFDASSIDAKADPCNDFYKFGCGKFAANHPIPADQTGSDLFYALYNVNTQSLHGILEKAAAGGAERSAGAACFRLLGDRRSTL